MDQDRHFALWTAMLVVILLWVLVGAWQKRRRLKGIARELGRRGPVRLSALGTIHGEVNGARFAVRRFFAQSPQERRGGGGAWQTLLFVETPTLPLEFMIEQETRIVAGVDVGVPLYRSFERQGFLHVPGVDTGYAYFTDQRPALQALLLDVSFVEELRRLGERPGFTYLLARELPRWTVRLVRDGFALLVPFRGRSGVALMRENPPGGEPGADELYQDLVLLCLAWDAIARAARPLTT